jgi:hypothetical protein
MKTTLVVENNSQLADFYGINLHTWVHSNCLHFQQARFIIEYLQKQESMPDLIITRGKIGSEHTADAIADYLSKTNTTIPIIVIGESNLDKTNFLHLESSLEIKGLIQASAKALKVTAQEMAKLEIPDFFEIPIQNFHIIDYTICDVYKLEDTGEHKIFIKTFDEVPAGTLKNLENQKISSLFIKKEERLKFVTNINQEIASKLQLKDLNEDEQVSAVEMSQELLQQKMERLCITP